MGHIILRRVSDTASMRPKNEVLMTNVSPFESIVFDLAVDFAHIHHKIKAAWRWAIAPFKASVSDAVAVGGVHVVGICKLTLEDDTTSSTQTFKLWERFDVVLHLNLLHAPSR